MLPSSMQINGNNIPFHVAKAYGVRSTASPKPAAPVARPSAAPTPTSDVPRAGSVRELDALAAGRRTARVDRLVGGTVHRPINFDGAATARTDGGPLQLYNRAADRVEAAIGVNVGRSIDVQG